jgi:hypothetical protein
MGRGVAIHGLPPLGCPRWQGDICHATVTYATGGMLLAGDDMRTCGEVERQRLKVMDPPTGEAMRFADDAFEVGPEAGWGPARVWHLRSHFGGAGRGRAPWPGPAARPAMSPGWRRPCSRLVLQAKSRLRAEEPALDFEHDSESAHRVRVGSPRE